jgi:hypothetical protein
MVEFGLTFSPLCTDKKNFESMFEDTLENVELEKMFASYFEQETPKKLPKHGLTPLTITPNPNCVVAKKLDDSAPSFLPAYQPAPLEHGFMHLLDEGNSLNTTFNLSSPLGVCTPNYAQYEALFNPDTCGEVKESKKKCAVKPKEEVVFDEKRTWNTVSFNEQFIKKEFLDTIKVTSKTRREKPSTTVPERLYSSLKYEIGLSASLSAFTQELPFVLARIRVVDSETFEIVKKNKKDAIKGVIEGAMTQNGNEKDYKGFLKTQFIDLSYHHEKKEYRWEVHFFAPSDLKNPILIKRSANFRVYARKPNVNKDKKRKCGSTENVPRKKVSKFAEFITRLDELVEFQKQNLKPEEKRRAMDLVMSKFISVDPSYVCNFLFPIQPQYHI